MGKDNRIANVIVMALATTIVVGIVVAPFAAMFYGIRYFKPDLYDSLEWWATSAWDSLDGYARYMATERRAHHLKEAREAYRRLLREALETNSVESVLLPHVTGQASRDRVDRHEQEYWLWQEVLDQPSPAKLDAFILLYPDGQMTSFAKFAKAWTTEKGMPPASFPIDVWLDETFIPADPTLSFKNFLDAPLLRSLFGDVTPTIRAGGGEQSGAPDRLTIRIVGRAEATGAYYVQAGMITGASFRFTGAKVGGHVAVEGFGRSARRPFGGSRKVPDRIREGSYQSPKDMPWKTIVSTETGSLHDVLVRSVADVLGPLWVVNQALPDMKYGGTRWAVAALAAESETTSVLRAGLEAVMWDTEQSNLTPYLVQALAARDSSVLCQLEIDASRREHYGKYGSFWNAGGHRRLQLGNSIARAAPAVKCP
jgi:hypothetical protein